MRLKKSVLRSKSHKVLMKEPQNINCYPRKKDLAALRTEESSKRPKKFDQNDFVPEKFEKNKYGPVKTFSSPVKKYFHPRKRSEDNDYTVKTTNFL